MFSTLLLATNAVTLALWRNELRKKRQIERRMLRMRMFPHFLFNKLSEIHYHYYTLDRKSSSNIIDMSNYLRYHLEHWDHESVPLSTEMAHLAQCTCYFAKNVDISTKVQLHLPQNNMDDLWITPTLLDDVVYNSFKQVRKKNGYINIKAYISRSHQLHLVCENDFEPTPKASTHSGIRNLNKLLQLYYKHQHNIDIHQDSDFFRIHVTVNLDKSLKC